MLHVNHPDDERYDEINIRVVPRWKESELSGDEWRFSYVAEVMRKGEKIIEVSTSKLEWLLSGLQWKILIAGEEGKSDIEAYQRTEDKCDQPGCKNVATVFYKRLRTYTSRGQRLDDNEEKDSYRQFCDSHTQRGDCDMDDADLNYVVISNPKEA